MESGAKDWKNVNGTGPYLLANYVQGNVVIRRQQWVDQLINPTLNGTWNRSIISGLYVYLPSVPTYMRHFRFA